MKKFYHIVTYGCQMNVHESEKIAGILRELGYEHCEDAEKSDIVVFNTCCIRENAENHAFGNIGMLKKLKAKNRNMIIAVGGCLTQQIGKAENVKAKFPYVDIIFGTHNLYKLKDYVLQKEKQKKAVINIEDDDGTVFEGDKPYRTSYPNAWVNITYGCNNFCSYCIVPYVRGRERSRKSENIIAEVKNLIDEGYKEITLLGQNVNSYGNGTQDITFPQLLEKIASLDGNFRLRFMTSHPKDFSEELAVVMAKYPKICHSLHLPVQSGSDAILKQMNRKYTVENYLGKLDILHRYVPDCAVTTDIIVGFPGETEADFNATLELVKKADFSSAFTFVYSKRQGTVAAKMPEQIPEEVSKRRIMELIELVNKQTRRHTEGYVGKTVEILCEDFDCKKQMYMGRDEYGRMGYFKSDKEEIGNFVKILIENANGVSLIGKKGLNMALSQMMQHYFSIKEKYKDCIVFYRLGDFYEMFFDDAKKASQLLDLTLTGRDCGLSERAPMCGIPFHAADNYIAKLVSLGEKVAICEQLEDAATAKGIVERGVIRVVTAGTITDDEHLDEKQSNYICCVYKIGQSIALCWADITTGELTVSEFDGENCIGRVISRMVNLGVKEVICNDDMLLSAQNVPEIVRGILPHFSNYPAWAFKYSAAERTLLEQFNAKTLSAYPVADKENTICAAGALIQYLKETQMHALKNINGIKYLSNDSFMQLDSAAVKNLELVKSLGSGKKYGSLLWLLDKTKTAMGARLLANGILYPYSSKDDISYRLDGVEELFNATVVRLGIIDLLKEMKDIERLTGKISNNIIMPRDCLALSQSLATVPNIKFQLSGFKSKVLNDISDNLFDLSSVYKLLDDAVNPKAPAQLKDGGYIKNGFNEQLDELRALNSNVSKLLLEVEARERDATGIRTLRIGFNRVFGYYIEVSKSFKDSVPLNYQRRQTLANAERYTTDELKELENKILGSEEAALKLEAQIYERIKSTLVENINNFKIIASAVAQLDLICSFAEIAKTNRYVRPQIVDSNQPFIIKDGRHPVVEAISKDRFIPNDLLLDEGENRTMILTGPNMAGKSTYMRQTAIIAIMAHLGSFVPAKTAQIPLIDRVFTRVGASDNLISDQSTFMVEMIEVASILQNATKNSLLILDEVGRGTSTYDGLSIAWAVTEYLTDNIGAKTMFATHYHELTELEYKMNGVKNFKISVKEVNGGIVFLRKIMRGGVNRSFGIEVASLAGVPDVVTSRAKQILKQIESGEKEFETHFEEEETLPEKSEIETILSEVDINGISPMQAFMILGDLVEKVKNKG